MPDKDCPTCSDHAGSPAYRDLPGEPVTGQEDVYAYAMPTRSQVSSRRTNAEAASMDAFEIAPGRAQTPFHELIGSTRSEPVEASRDEFVNAEPTEAVRHRPGRDELAIQPPPVVSPGEATSASYREGVIHDNILDATPSSVENLPPVRGPWASVSGVVFQEQPDTEGKPGAESDPDSEGEPELPPPIGRREPPEDEEAEDTDDKGPTGEVTRWGPNAGKVPEDVPAGGAYKKKEHRQIKKRPPKGGGPRIALPDDDDAKDFVDDWEDSSAWLPLESVRLACPTEITHKVHIWWIDHSSIGRTSSYDAAKRLADGALESNDPEDVLSESLDGDIPDKRLNEVLDNLGWECDPDCRLVANIIGYDYHIIVNVRIEQHVNYDTGEEGYLVRLIVIHQMWMWVHIRCVS